MRIGPAILLAASAFAARPPFTPADWWTWRTASDPRISPDGKWAVWVESWNDRETGASFSNLWLAPSDGRDRKQWTNGPWRDTSPRWSPDSERLAWFSTRGGRKAIHVRRAAAGQDMDIPIPGADPRDLAWSPGGDSLVFTAAVPALTPPPAWAPPAILGRLRVEPVARRRIFIARFDGQPPRPIGSDDSDYGGPQWMLDARSVIAIRDGAAVVSVAVADGASKVLASGARVRDPLVAPDGSRIAWLSTAIRPQSYTIRKLWVMNPDGSRARTLSGSLDRDPDHPQWSADARTVYFTADDRGYTRVYAARNDGTVRQVTSRPERLHGFSLADNGRAVSIRESGTEAGDVVTFTVDVVSQPVTLASPNGALLATREIAPVEELSYQSGAHAIQAWLVKPANPAKAPLLLDIHDAPRAMCGPAFDLRAQVLAARGFAVLCVNSRGTPGFGEEFGNLLHTRYPGDDYEDLMRGVDAVVAKGVADPQRLFVSGGLLAAWTIGQTARFRAAVVRRPVVDWVLEVATSPDGARHASEWMGAMPWENPDQYVKHSPIYFAGNFKTPVLILAAEHDAATEELYFALRQRKVEAAFLRAPLDWPATLEAILAWLSR